MREAGIFQIEENGSELCELSTNSSFVCVRIPIRIEGGGAKNEATSHYSIGSFAGRDTPLTLLEGLQTTLRFRIPLELFRARERFAVEVLADGVFSPEKILWAKRWTVVWQGKTPSLEPMPD